MRQFITSTSKQGHLLPRAPSAHLPRAELSCCGCCCHRRQVHALPALLLTRHIGEAVSLSRGLPLIPCFLLLTFSVILNFNLSAHYLLSSRFPGNQNTAGNREEATPREDKRAQRLAIQHLACAVALFLKSVALLWRKKELRMDR